MKKLTIVFIILTTTLLASDSFWKKLIDIEESFFNKVTILELIKRGDGNLSIENNESSSILDKQFNSFLSLVNLLKNNPYSLDLNRTIYIDLRKNRREISNLKLKIDTNMKYGYTQAVSRDMIKLQSLQTKEQIYNFFRYIAHNWTLLDEDTLKRYLKETKSELHRSIDMKQNIRVYLSLKNQNSYIAQNIKDNFFILSKDYYFFDSFLKYLQLNINIFNYHSLSNQLKLDNLIDYINRKGISKDLNLYLRYFKMDTGRLFLFFIVILIFIVINYLIYRKLYNYFKAKILEVEDETDDILIANLNRIRVPISLLINGIGLQIALEILNYPDSISDKTHLYFTLFFILVIAYITMQIIENIFFIYFHHSSSKNITLRTELINLMLSISQFIILLIATLIAFVKMGINISGVIAFLGIGGLAVALAAKDTLSNFFGLIKIIFDESFSQGDWIKTDDVEGIVIEIGFISTKIRTFDNAMITVPNEKLANTAIKNWSKRTIGRKIELHIGVTYSSNREDVQNAIDNISNMLLNHDGISTPEKIDHKEIKKHYRRSNKFVSLNSKLGIKSKMMVYLDSFSDSSIDIFIYTFTKTIHWQEWLEVKQDILYKIWEILEKNNLEFAFPSQSIYIEKS